MSKFFFYLSAIAESGLSAVGIRAPYEQPGYTVERTLGNQVELRLYAPRMAVEADIAGTNDGEAFGRLFRYIAGANIAGQNIKMTAPVEQTSKTIAMTVPVEMAGAPGAQTMRFFLPRAVASAGPPRPADPKLRIVSLPQTRLATIRFAGAADDAARMKAFATLKEVLDHASIVYEGPPSLLSYDPPFALPFLRRNEIAVLLSTETPK